MARVVIAGVARNFAASFETEMAQIRQAFAHHDVARVVIVESDSTDGSASCLEEWSCRQVENTYFALGCLQRTYPRRTERLAYCRNVYMKYLERYDFFGAQYLYVCDLDGVNGLLTSETLDTVISELQRISGGAATANQRYKYYDIWALRHPVWSPDDCWAGFHKIRSLVGDINAHAICTASRMIHIDSALPPIEVVSAFGGGALYSTSKVAGCRYQGIANGAETCEQIGFSADYRSNGGRIFIFPSFINHDRSEHVLNAEAFPDVLHSASMIPE